tara:strand:+ start:726 stop:971 length:246 start_codon:yes stop_codon:yes gene_type:complete
MSDKKVAPLACPLCDILFADKDDVMSWHQHGCCSTCRDFFMYPNQKKWNAGWRPSQEEIDDLLRRINPDAAYLGSSPLKGV